MESFSSKTSSDGDRFRTFESKFVEIPSLNVGLNRKHFTVWQQWEVHSVAIVSNRDATRSSEKIPAIDIDFLFYLRSTVIVKQNLQTRFVFIYLK